MKESRASESNNESKQRMLTWGMKEIWVDETTPTKQDSLSCQLRDIYITWFTYQYSREPRNRYSWSCLLFLWNWSTKEDLSIHQLIRSHFSLLTCSSNSRIFFQSIFGHLDHHLEEHIHQVQWIAGSVNLDHHSDHSITFKHNWIRFLERVSTKNNCLKLRKV